MMRFLPLGILVVLAILLGLGLGKDPAVIPSPLIGKQTPEFELATLSKQPALVSKQALRGKPYLLNVWATWCANCLVEHPVFMRIAQQNDIALIGLNYKDDKNAARQWLSKYGNPYQQVLVDQDGKVGIDFGVYGAPETFLIDADGIVRDKIIGPVTEQIWTERLSPAINALSPGS